MSRAAVGIAMGLAAILPGCAHLGGRRLPVESEPGQAAGVVTAYVQSYPVRMQALQSVVIRWRGRPFTALGWLRYDRTQGTFALVGMNPAGATLFSLTETGGQPSATFAALPGGDPAAWTRAMAEDIRRIYFDSLPAAEGPARVDNGDTIVERNLPDGVRLRLRFATRGAKPDHDLVAVTSVHARWSSGSRRLGTTIYEEYQTVGAAQVASRIVHRNHQYGYELVIRLKQVQSVETLLAASR